MPDRSCLSRTVPGAGSGTGYSRISKRSPTITTARPVRGMALSSIGGISDGFSDGIRQVIGSGRPGGPQIVPPRWYSRSRHRRANDAPRVRTLVSAGQVTLERAGQPPLQHRAELLDPDRLAQVI